jgi:hypothetical protein
VSIGREGLPHTAYDACQDLHHGDTLSASITLGLQSSR